MADDKDGRERQARDADNRQRRREMEAAVARGDEPEPESDKRPFVDLGGDLEAVSFPATGAAIVDSVGDHEIEAPSGEYAVRELVPAVSGWTFDAPPALEEYLGRPTVAAAMTRIEEASAELLGGSPSGSQREAYEKTFLALRRLDADDDDEWIDLVADWIVDQIEQKDELPGSRAVRRQAAKVCRAHGYEISNDDWLGV